MIKWLKAWYISWLVWRSMDDEQRALINSGFNEEDFVEIDRPEEN